jgi:hypothetical protein
MSDSKFSPGPWRWDRESLLDAEDCLITQITDTLAPGEGNARLIAAAPEMYELLASLARTTLNPDTWHERVTALLARIDGKAPG